jgi:hypothetical protein
VHPTALLRPLRFRFTEAADIQRYGGDWHVYDEAAIMRLDAREQMRLEEQIDASLVWVIRSFRTDGTLGLLAATWLALRLEDPDLPGPFESYTPLVHFADWETVPDEESKASVAGPFDPTPSTPSAEPSPSE